MNHIINNSIKNTEMGNVHVNSKAETQNIISVSDTGNGKTEHYLPYIFDSFIREQQGYNENTKEMDKEWLQ